MITVYSKAVCPHCQQAKNFLIRNGIPFKVVDVMEDEGALNFIRSRGHQTVPQIYVGSTLLVEGGNAELQKLSLTEVNRRVQVALKG